MKITYSLWTKVDPTSSSTAQTKRDQKEEFIDLVTKSGSLRTGIAFLNECYDHIIVRKTQNSVFDSLSAPDQSKVRGKPRYSEDENFSIESIMLSSNGPASRNPIYDIGGGGGGEKKTQFSVCITSVIEQWQTSRHALDKIVLFHTILDYQNLSATL